MYVSTCNNEIDNHGHVSTIIILTLISVVTLVKLTTTSKRVLCISSNHKFLCTLYMYTELIMYSKPQIGHSMLLIEFCPQTHVYILVY